MMKRITLITGFEDRLRKMLQCPPKGWCLLERGPGIHNQLHQQYWLTLQSRDVQSSIIDRGLVILVLENVYMWFSITAKQMNIDASVPRSLAINNVIFVIFKRTHPTYYYVVSIGSPPMDNWTWKPTLSPSIAAYVCMHAFECNDASLRTK